MPHGWASTHKCENCGHTFKEGEDKRVYEDWKKGEHDRHGRLNPKRWVKCVGCAEREGGSLAGIESYVVKHKEGYVT